MNTVQILQFLEQLQENNNKPWMDMHKADYLAARNTLLEITDQLIKGLGKIDTEIASLTPKDCVFRINRDIRFSKDKSPYKINMGAYLTKGGKHGGCAGYYLHLQPHGQSFIAGGSYQPMPDALKQIRQEIDYNGDKLKVIVSDKKFKEFFGNLHGESLQRPPKGYDDTHPYIDWIKLKSFLVMHPIPDKKVASTDFIKQVLEGFKLLVPLNQFLNSALETVDHE
ncbi:MAG: TIGR02453 family protein [Candidatus Amoebophilus sp. 36-38]|nr:MAG: TIGR02453 family protein [Candidatus Amoebophilus sp. 36-38]